MNRGLAQLAVFGMIGALALGLSSPTSAGDNPAGDDIQLGRAVYGRTCVVCHGPKGDGNGMMAHMFRIKPLDFRAGVFKFRSTPLGALPTDEDLERTVAKGVRWTAMVGHPQLSLRERRAVVKYLKTFSPRFADEEAPPPIIVPPSPPVTPALAKRGGMVFGRAGCAQCHGKEGRGDGPLVENLKDRWGRPITPPDLTWRPLKRGSDTRDIYLTIATGLDGTPMPSFAKVLEPEEIWALVAYLESIVEREHRPVDLDKPLNREESMGRMVIRMHGRMGGGMGGMMERMPMMK